MMSWLKQSIHLKRGSSLNPAIPVTPSTTPLLKFMTDTDLLFWQTEYPDLTDNEIIDIIDAVNADSNWQQDASDD